MSYSQFNPFLESKDSVINFGDDTHNTFNNKFSKENPLKGVLSGDDTDVGGDTQQDNNDTVVTFNNEIPKENGDEDFFSNTEELDNNVEDESSKCACSGECVCNGIKQTFSIGASVLTALPPALNAFANAMNVSPAESIKLFLTKDLGIQVFSVANGASSLAINTIMNAYYLPTALGKFADSVKHSFDSSSAFFSNLVTMTFGLGGAIATSAISYEAFQWLPGGSFSAAIPTFLGFSVFFATRYVGVLNLFNRVYNILNPDTATQAQFGDAINHIKEDKLDEVHRRFFEVLDSLFAVELQGKNSDVQFTTAEMDLIADRLAGVLNDIAELHPDLINEPSTTEYVTKYAGLIFDIAFAISCGLPAYLTFMQKSFDGISIIAKFAGGDLSHLNPWLKPCIGTVQGLASGMLYFDSASKFRGILVELAQYVWEAPKRLAVAVPLLVANYLSAYGPENIAAGVIKNKFNIIGIYDGTVLGDVFKKLNLAGGLAVNGGSSINKVMTSFFAEPVTRNNIKLSDVGKHLQTNFDNISKPESESRLGKYGMFLSKMESAKAEKKSLVINEEPVNDAVIDFNW